MYIHFNRKYQKIIWLLIGFFACCLLTDKVLALTTLDGQNFPNIPDTSKGAVIYTYNNDYFILQYQGSCSSYSYITISNNDHLTMGSCYMAQYKLVNDSWVSQGTKQNQPFSTIVATTTNLGGALNGQTITGGYNLIKQQEDFTNYTQDGYSSHGIYFNQNNISNIWNSFFEGKSPSYFYTYNNNYTGGNSVYKNWTNELHASDYPNISCRYMDNSYFDCYFLPNTDFLNSSGSSSSVYLSPNYTDPYPIFHFKMQVNSPNISNISFATSFSYYTNYSSTYTSNFNIVNPSNGTTYNTKKFDYAPSSLPDYLTGYKKITLTPEDKYYMLSGLSSGSVYIPTSDFEEYGGRLSYYDNDLTSQPYTSYIQDYYKMPDGEFIRQDFDLSQFYGADWVMFSKYIYLEGEDNITYDIWVPNDIYDSQVTITPNSSGGNTFDFDYQDSNGNIQNGQVNSVDLSQDNPLLGNIFSDFSSNTFGLTSIITAPLSLIRSLSSTSCTPLNLPLPFVGGTLTLPCMYSFYSSTFGSLFTLYQTITFGIVAYWVIVRIFNLVKDFKNPDHDEIEVIDL